MNIECLKKEIIAIGKRLYDKDLTYGTSGNISIKCEDYFLITASGTSLADLTEEDIAAVDFNGVDVDENCRASSEKKLHLEVYTRRPDLKSIIHCHSPALSTFAVAHQDLDQPSMAENILYFGKIPVAKYGMPSSDELVENTVKYFSEYDVVLMANHGVVAGDKDLKHAFYKIETAEAYAKITLYSKILGKEVLLSEKEVKDLENLKRSLIS